MYHHRYVPVLCYDYFLLLNAIVLSIHNSLIQYLVKRKPENISTALCFYRLLVGISGIFWYCIWNTNTISVYLESTGFNAIIDAYNTVQYNIVNIIAMLNNAILWRRKHFMWAYKCINNVLCVYISWFWKVLEIKIIEL